MFKPTTFGKYYLTERLAVGGMAEIYKAKLRGVGGVERGMVVKQILPQLARNQTFVDMFIDEARIAVSLAHGNIVQVYELGKIEGVYFIAMEYVHGRDLADLLDAAYMKSHFPPWELAAYITIEILHGLDYAHRRRDEAGKSLGIVHRDISPQNILISFEGEIKIADFGIAKAVHKMAETQAGVIKGKFGYMSPEQAEGQDVDARTDLFSTGILLYEMVTGRRLFAGRSDAESLEKVRAAEVPRASQMRGGVPEELDAILCTALARKPEERYPDANSFQLELSRFLFAHGGGATPLKLSLYMRELFGEATGEHAPIAEPAPVLHLPLDPVAEVTENLLDDLARGALRKPERPPSRAPASARSKVSTQVLDAQTDALMGELGIGGEPIETPLPPAPERLLQWTAQSRAIEKPPSPLQSNPTTPLEVFRRRTDPAAPHELLRERATAREVPPPELLAASHPTGMSPAALAPPGGHALYLAAVSVLAVVLGVVLWKTEVLSGGFRARKSAESRVHAEAQRAGGRAAAPPPRYGTVDIGASSDHARVLLYIGRAPVDVPHLDVGVTQELRLEQAGYWPQTVMVPPAVWQGGQQALFQVALVPSATNPPIEPRAPAGERMADKFGTLRLASRPEGAEVWLLVGFTPTMHMEGLRADRDYRFEVVAEHHLPAVVELRPGDWKDESGRLTFRSDLTLREDPKDPIPVIRVNKRSKAPVRTVKF